MPVLSAVLAGYCKFTAVIAVGVFGQGSVVLVSFNDVNRAVCKYQPNVALAVGSDTNGAAGIVVPFNIDTRECDVRRNSVRYKNSIFADGASVCILYRDTLVRKNRKDKRIRIVCVIHAIYELLTAVRGINIESEVSHLSKIVNAVINVNRGFISHLYRYQTAFRHIDIA